MFEKILAELKTKYKNLGLSETILKAKAKQIEKAVKTEGEIADAVAGVEDDLAIFQSFADQNRTLAKKIEDLEKAKGTDPKSADPTDPKPTDPPANPNPAPTGDVPEWAKAIIESNKTLAESLTAMKTKEAQQTNAQKLQAKLTELKVSQAYLDLLPQSPTERTFQNDEEIEAFATSLKAKSEAYDQSVANGALKSNATPLFGEAKKEGDVSPDVQSYLDSKKPAKTNE
ncbi:hypothetical protein FY557_17530 [Chryseobacterium sp. SN22]|uniref:hypothetical protein n=1 Tax=Chryseobacterium sp. SN22 TaxID=2606431 RepID=UPI0011EDB9A8|nr:hypothetical protein [Chryseobacterium sp. SN22]KAA0126451.1 hypothetical protein FY557_17530 [Chryseobacterium sp. SN22]